MFIKKIISSKVYRISLARKLLFFSAFGFIAIWCFAFLMLGDASNNDRLLAAYISLIPFFGFFMSWSYIHNSICPKCNNRFTLKKEFPWQYNPFTTKCLNCGGTLDED